MYGYTAKVLPLVRKSSDDRKVPPICAAIRRERDGANLTQAGLGERLGVQQGQVGKWETEREPSLDTIRAIEDVLGLRRGQLLRDAGYVIELRTTADAISSDPLLDRQGRTIVLRVYEAAIVEAEVDELGDAGEDPT